MAQQLVTDAGTLTIPGAYPEIVVAQSNSGLSANGTIFLVGEADAGPDFASEADLALNLFGPTQDGNVVAKYKSGNLVDAFKTITAPANDQDFTGAWNRVVMVKTNRSTKASCSLTVQGGGTYANLQDRSYGKLGNLISREIKAKTNEVVPTTGPFALLSPTVATDVEFRVNGGGAISLQFSAGEAISAMATALKGLSGLAVTGGTNRAVLGAGGDLALTVTGGNTVLVSFGGTFAAQPMAGDSMFISAASVISGTNDVNAGSYVVLSASERSLTAVKVLDATGGATSLTSPTAATGTSSDGSDIAVFSPVVVSAPAAAAVAGLGKSLEVAEKTSSAGIISTIFKTLIGSTVSNVSWISKANTPKTITSASEYVAEMTFSRQFDNISEDLYAGGQAALLLSYVGTTAQAVISDGVLTITVTGGTGSSPDPITLADYPTISDLAKYICTLTGFTASPGTAVIGASPTLSLDEGTFNIASVFGAFTGRIKQDAWKVFNKINSESVLVQLDKEPSAGQPAVAALGYLTGGAKGSTSDSAVAAAIDAIGKISGNFVVPLFSRDAYNDIVDGQTDPASTYTIDGINAYVRSHVLKMATLKRRKNRQAFLSYRGTFLDAKTRSANLGQQRCSMSFMDVRVAPNGTVKQYQPWMCAALAASMQAVGFYRPIVARGVNISGALQAAGDFDPSDIDQLEDALTSGLLPLRRNDAGRWIWGSDQTTYAQDNNWIFNSIQATYVADLVALTTSMRMEAAFVGKSIADVSATLALTTLEGIMDDMLKLKLLAKSDDAPRGYRNAKIKISGPAMQVSLEIKVAGAIYFIPIRFMVTQVQQSASS